MAITFFKRPKNKQFNYKPVFWDKAKEERENRTKLALDEKDKDYSEALRKRLDYRWRRNSAIKSNRNSNLRLIVIIVGLSLLSYYLFF
jgi:hypothetical protein